MQKIGCKIALLIPAEGEEINRQWVDIAGLEVALAEQQKPFHFCCWLGAMAMFQGTLPFVLVYQ
jgi:hypothetical protein